MVESPEQIIPFYVKDCALIAIATGEKAHSLGEFRNKLATIPDECIYYHFWGERLKSRFFQPDYYNDFARWANECLHDKFLAERLGIIDPTEYENLESLRQDLIEVVEIRLDEREKVHGLQADEPFHFIRSQIVIFDTLIQIEEPADLSQTLPILTPTSLFYHFIDARTRTKEEADDFSLWLNSFGNLYQDLIQEIQQIDPYFLSLGELQKELTLKLNSYFRGRSDK